SPWRAMHYRLVGPFRGGRVLAVSGVVGDTNTYYFGGVAGGVWKTTDGGLNWQPIFDKVKGASPSIGAIAVAESDPNVIYVGTGEACIRGNIVGGHDVELYRFGRYSRYRTNHRKSEGRGCGVRCGAWASLWGECGARRFPFAG